MLKDTPPAPRPREPTAEELAHYKASNERRIAATNRALYLLGQLETDEVHGVNVLLEELLRDRRCLDGIDRERAYQAARYLLPAGEW